ALLDRLSPGAVVQTGPRSELTLVFFDGARAVVEAGSRAVIRTGDTTAAVAGRVRPETLHYWRLSSPAGDGRRLHGDGLFVVLDEAASGARRQLAEQAAASRDPGLEMLLAEADRRLGLRREACLGLASAVRRHPDNGALERALQRFECGGWHLGVWP
ncbi:MAG: hypothetical protein GY722_28345, partial [bacterium]|nr:hypothetical protein [bacterium]